ncbi:SusD/RagB family nutrient-binding outer membrane lipoprotein [Mucilaginibacter ginsenosidivorans]|uniref:SusD/RagB family nutrient-binding outer membrane lipoprotein n=1 Tax=Mucilaginibacter ginsenosidivorans TaxID=398053 RepID=A0A5B8V2C1_9SPHI|nr:SusD/RagB family nutrient-binding outer membrane lipoprotein [Mucilaginibacter ginsenosidivorans]QEC65215.1 SusD/RagB family nutrient-binding outer membrane lipoprotein [Mucilaginibacter ginsenosidivorans]
MKKIYLGVCLVSIIAIMTPACKKNFVAINTDPNAISSPTVPYLFSKAELDAFNANYYASQISNVAGFIQHFANYKLASGFGDKYLTNNEGGAALNVYYQNTVSEISDVIRASSDPADVNKLAEARIWRVYVMHRMTDQFGDLPYSQAAQGYVNNTFFPVYDAQSDIYSDMLNELDAAAQAFDAGKATFGTADLLYGGNISNWKKFAYSLMLRLGMRLTKVDPANAQKWVQKAIAGGVILNDADIAVMKYQSGSININRNPIAVELIGNDYSATAYGLNLIEGDKYSNTYINYLKNNNDPRLSVLAVVWNYQDPNNPVPDTTAANQKGMPNGLTSQPVNFESYSEPNPATILQYTAPLMVLTNAETNLLLAEATLRGWTTEGTAATYYSAGVTAAMHQWALYGSAGAISAVKIDAYLAAHPLAPGTFDQQMEQIHTQFWASLIYDEYESFSNWRRTGYPVLTPVNYQGNNSNGTIPRRMMYPLSEASINTANYNAAVSRQGPDLLTTHVWWDK